MPLFQKIVCQHCGKEGSYTVPEGLRLTDGQKLAAARKVIEDLTPDLRKDWQKEPIEPKKVRWWSR